MKCACPSDRLFVRKRSINKQGDGLEAGGRVVLSRINNRGDPENAGNSYRVARQLLPSMETESGSLRAQTWRKFQRFILYCKQRTAAGKVIAVQRLRQFLRDGRFYTQAARALEVDIR